MGQPPVCRWRERRGVSHFSQKKREAGHPNSSSYRFKIPNPFWQARFYDFNVWTEKKRIEKLRYIHRNPVTRGLVDAPEKWSSFRWYRYGEAGPVKINDTDILVMRIRPPAA